MIYETKGRAREYFELAANLYQGCEHGCLYCYGPDVLKVSREAFHKRPTARRAALQLLAQDAKALQEKGETRPVLLSFITDPYQPIETEWRLTRKAIEILHAADLPVAILTKGGTRAAADFDLLGPADMFGATLTFATKAKSLEWEPGAAEPFDRLNALRQAHDKGIQTFVSLEPVVYPDDTLQLIREAAPFTDFFKVGKLNYKRPPVEVNWAEFAWNAVRALQATGKRYYVKEDLAKYIGRRAFSGGEGGK